MSTQWSGSEAGRRRHGAGRGVASTERLEDVEVQVATGALVPRVLPPTARHAGGKQTQKEKEPSTAVGVAGRRPHRAVEGGGGGGACLRGQFTEQVTERRGQNTAGLGQRAQATRPQPRRCGTARGTGLLPSAEAGEGFFRVEEVEEEQRGVLVVEEASVCRLDRVECVAVEWWRRSSRGRSRTKCT